MPTEDDLMRVDMTELESIPSSELYPREVAPVKAAANALGLVRAAVLVSTGARSLPLPRF